MGFTLRLSLAILSLCLIFGGSCAHRQKVIVLPSDQRIMMIEGGKAYFADKVVPWTEVEGWLIISPGNAQEYLEWAASRESE